ncbi:hypothetical protein GH714_022307 [Hevea brasiliensis]|uniref:Uncharacterized protein n=1 Tax=Hevea brasiliensis TaxID=3981 RepID=A0A6A6LMH5_HEVBR|nr:hypothetical protein GH714_022307 [Hevea brasiliensis]
MGEDTLLKKDKTELASSGRKNAIYEGYNLPCSSEDEVTSPHRRNSSDLDSLQATSIEKEESKIEEPRKSTGNVLDEDDLISEAKPKPRSVRRRPLKPLPGHENFGSDAMPLNSPKGHENVGSIERPLKPPPGREKFVSPENGGFAKANSIAAKEAEAERVLRISKADDVDEREEEDKMIDELLMHYSKDTKSNELPLPPGREAYQAEEASTTKAAKRQNQVVSLQSETGHVHPNLPDYEYLAARFAALKGK